MKTPPPDVARISTGVAGLDLILGGGLPTNHLYLLSGEPGTGKTTLAMQFLLAGTATGARALYVTLSESRAELVQVAESHGWSLDDIDLFEFSADDAIAGSEGGYTLFHPSEVELQQTMDAVLAAVDAAGAQYVVLDSLSEMRLLARDPLRFRRQILALKQFFAQRQCTVLMLDDQSAPEGDLQLHSLAHGVIELDTLLGGGLHQGTSLLITGPAGTGKSVLATQLACAAVARGERVRFHLFDERLSTFHLRAEGLGLKLREAVDGGLLQLCQVEPTQLSPGEFAHQIVQAVEEEDVKLVVIDSINGFLQSMPEERLLTTQVHELLSYLSNRGVTCIMTLVQRGIFGSPVDEAADVSYLADVVVLLRYFEMQGAVRQAVSVVKKRGGDHERTIRETRVRAGGLHVGAPLTAFQGVLTGVPHYSGSQAQLMAPVGAGDPGDDRNP